MKKHGRSILVVFVLVALCSALPVVMEAQEAKVAYGANAAAGHFLQVEDVKLYYEIYGSGGTTLVLLHGGLYGYIEEFGDLIRELSKSRRVIAIATRGHGKSEIGKQPFSYELFAKDAYAIVSHETHEKVDVLGFSDGAVTSYALTAMHPEMARKLVAIGGPRSFLHWSEQSQKEFKESKATDVERDAPGFVAERKKLMPEPQRWVEFNEKLMKMWAGTVYVTDEQIKSIKIPALMMAGDHDPYNQAEKLVELYKLLPQGQLATIPGCGHVVLDCKAGVVIEEVREFLDGK